jgi:hypothetical protein
LAFSIAVHHEPSCASAFSRAVVDAASFSRQTATILKVVLGNTLLANWLPLVVAGVGGAKGVFGEALSLRELEVVLTGSAALTGELVAVGNVAKGIGELEGKSAFVASSV